MKILFRVARARVVSERASDDFLFTLQFFQKHFLFRNFSRAYMLVVVFGWSAYAGELFMLLIQTVLWTQMMRRGI